MSLMENIKMMVGVLVLALALYLLSTLHLAYGLLCVLLAVIPLYKIVK